MAESKAKKTTTKKTASKKTTPKASKPKKVEKKLDIGIDVKLPTKICDDQFCPFHGTLSVRGQILDGIVNVCPRPHFIRLG